MSLTKMYSRMYAATRRLGSDDKGVTALEYGILASLIIVAAVVGIAALGTGLNDQFAALVARLKS